MNVLLAEDNPVNQEIAIGLLETLDCAVTVVENGKDAVTAAAGGAFDLVLMDCQMPIMDGLEAARAIRTASDGNARLPIVALTANDFETAHVECLAAGMDDLLGKPFSREDLSSLLKRWRPAPSQRSPAAPAPSSRAPRESSLDLASIETLRMLDPAGEKHLVQRTIEKFLDYGDDLIARLNESNRQGDVAELSRIVHSLKSSSANLGAIDLARQCAEIEEGARQGKLPSDIDQRLVDLKTAYQIAKRDLLLLRDT